MKNKAIIIGLVSGMVMVTALGAFSIISPKTYICGTDVYCPDQNFGDKFFVRHLETNKPVTGIVKGKINKSTFKASVKDGYLDGNLKEYGYEHLLRDCNFKNGKMDGLSKGYYGENGQLWWERTYKDGEKDGPEKWYYENGQLMSEQTYKNGKEDGPGKRYNRNGELNGEAIYKDGRLIECRGNCY
ncbi:MAG: hypothetical protein J6P93_00710 [Alphaproteobacteria bacterium]|nr:hypothetical protein [Alphaproteobacteria bacterium]